MVNTDEQAAHEGHSQDARIMNSDLSRETLSEKTTQVYPIAIPPPALALPQRLTAAHLAGLDRVTLDDSSSDESGAVEDATQAPSFEKKPIVIASTKEIDQWDTQDLVDRHPLPNIAGPDISSQARYHWLSLYRRFMIIVLLANAVSIAALLGTRISSFGYQEASIGCGANLLVSVVMRHEHFVNLLFRLACALPHRTPLPIRRFAAKSAYSNGGVHAGCGISALLWYVVYSVMLLVQFQGTTSQIHAVDTTVVVILLLFVIIIGAAHPEFRKRYHDAWELTHRYCGWASIAVFWLQLVIVAVAGGQHTHTSTGLVLARNPVFWFLIIITMCLIYPWLWLRRVPIEANKLSDHATELRFYNRSVSTCVSTRFATDPLVENHGFATISHGEGDKGYSIIVSKAGDFTTKLIQSPPKHIWMRGAPTTGVMRIAGIFTPVVIVTTGSGIAPCLSFLNLNPQHKSRIIWSGRSPTTTWGPGIVEQVLRADKDAIIIDTKKSGHPNLPTLAYALYKEIEAEAIVVISNPKVTGDVVYEMEARKVPAFGVIFDS